MTNLEKIFIFFLLVSLLLSFYFFVSHIIFKNDKHTNVYNTWQFPMLFAIFMDVIYKFR